MNKVVTINLNSNAYQVDETGYMALKEYLEGAEVQLADNPDRSEIMADLEQAIADKCRKFLGPNKTVVAASEVSQIIAEMGPVDGSAAETSDEQATRERKTDDPKAGANPAKRLYLIREGSMLSGVCQGIGAYLHVDPTIIRILFVVLTILTHGFFAILYAVLAILIPAATTSEERAAAQGKRFSAQDVIDDAKKTYEDFRNSNKEWKKKWRQQKREWKRKWRVETARWSQNLHQNLGYSGQLLAGLMIPLHLLVSLVLPIAAIVVIVALMNGKLAPDWALPVRVPGFLELMLVLAVIAVVTSPLRFARRASYYGGGSYALWEVWSGFIWLGFLAIAGLLVYFAVPQVHYIINNLPDILDGIFGR
jgi:phage shock protein PspC (stress-responsive transcriptional regulator)